jgi:hypothetical protein
MSTEAVKNWKELLPSLIKNYALEDVWNLDETGLFWRGLPNRSLVEKSDAAKGSKLAKERVTVCLLCSCTGEKYIPLVIGKSAMPRAFKKRTPTSVIWHSNKTAWMQANLFLSYMKRFDSHMQLQGRSHLVYLTMHRFMLNASSYYFCRRILQLEHNHWTPELSRILKSNTGNRLLTIF